MNHTKSLTALLDACVAASGETLEQKEIFWSYMTGLIPNIAAEEIFNENQMKVTGKEPELYSRVYRELRNDVRIEHLKDKDLAYRLSNVVQEAISDKKVWSSREDRKKLIAEFLEGLVRPLERFQILFRIEHLDATVDEMQFMDCTLVTCSKNWLDAWGLNESRVQIAGIDYFEDRNGILVEEVGNNLNEIVKRARLKANRRLQTLKSYLKVGYIHDFQLLFEISERYAIKNLESGKVNSGAERSPKSPLKYDYADTLKEYAETINRDFELTQSLTPKIQDLLDRTQYWIGLSISEIEMDIKIAHLCTALETLLTTKGDKRKGEKIAYRGYLLAMEIGAETRKYQPQKILSIYEKRSSIVHGSNFGIAVRNDYWQLLGFAKHSLRNFIIHESKARFGKQTKLYKGLLSSRHLIPLVTWLELYPTNDLSRNLLESIKEDWFKIR